jgi:hypothetical protein
VIAIRRSAVNDAMAKSPLARQTKEGRFLSAVRRLENRRSLRGSPDAPRWGIALFGAEGLDRIHQGCAARGNQACEKSSNRQQQGGRAEQQRVVRRNFV